MSLHRPGVTLVLLTLLAFAAALTGCSSGQKPAGPVLGTEVVSYASSPASVLVVAGVRSAEPPGMSPVAASGVSPLQPNKRSMIRVQVPQKSAADFQSKGIVRVRVEAVGTSWEQSRVAWYEIVGPMPVVLRVYDGPGSYLRLEKGPGSDQTRLEAVPKEWWPREAPAPPANAPAPSQPAK